METYFCVDLNDKGMQLIENSLSYRAFSFYSSSAEMCARIIMCLRGIKKETNSLLQRAQCGDEGP